MYNYTIEGEGYSKEKVKKIGRAVAVTVNPDWVGKEVLVILRGDILKFEKTKAKD